MAQSQSQLANSRPANAMLASSLLASLDSDQESGADLPISSRSTKRKRTGTGCMAIDSALDGGIVHGKGGMCCISGERGVGKTGLSLAFLVSHLLVSSTSHAAIIDTTGTFDVASLYETILARLRKDVTLPRVHQVANGAELAGSRDSISHLEDVVAKILERVKIMRVFDFDGVVEAVGEIRDELEKVVRDPVHLPSPPCPAPLQSKRMAREEVADSEDEDDGLYEDEEDMLYGGASKPEVPRTTLESPKSGVQGEESEKGAKDEGGKISMIVIDNITQVLDPLLKRNYVQAHALLTTFLRDLTNLTHSHNLTTTLLNSAISPRHPQNPSAPPSKYHFHHQGNDHPSIFTSNLAYPALGKTFPYFLDLHLLLSKLPWRRNDADIYYSNQDQDRNREQQQGNQGKGNRNVEMVNVIEVLSDRWEGRVGQWGAFRFLEEEGLELEGVVYD